MHSAKSVSSTKVKATKLASVLSFVLVPLLSVSWVIVYAVYNVLDDSSPSRPSLTAALDILQFVMLVLMATVVAVHILLITFLYWDMQRDDTLVDKRIQLTYLVAWFLCIGVALIPTYTSAGIGLLGWYVVALMPTAWRGYGDRP
jgi:hypothetical protein